MIIRNFRPACRSSFAACTAALALLFRENGSAFLLLEEEEIVRACAETLRNLKLVRAGAATDIERVANICPVHRVSETGSGSGERDQESV